MNFELWNETTKTYSNLADIFAFTGSESDYFTKPLDDFYFEEVTDNSVSRIRGFFVPPHDGEYSFHILSNGGADLYLTTNPADTKNPADKVISYTAKCATHEFHT